MVKHIHRNARAQNKPLPITYLYFGTSSELHLTWNGRAEPLRLLPSWVTLASLSQAISLSGPGRPEVPFYPCCPRITVDTVSFFSTHSSLEKIISYLPISPSKLHDSLQTSPGNPSLNASLKTLSHLCLHLFPHPLAHCLYQPLSPPWSQHPAEMSPSRTIMLLRSVQEGSPTTNSPQDL